MARLDLTTPEVHRWREEITEQVNENSRRLDALEKGDADGK